VFGLPFNNRHIFLSYGARAIRLRCIEGAATLRREQATLGMFVRQIKTKVEGAALAVGTLNMQFAAHLT